MRVLLQRVKTASVEVDGQEVGEIGQGLLLLVGIQRHDNDTLIERMAERVLSYRVFADPQGKMNLSVADIGGSVLTVSQFTLAADTDKGLRPGFSGAAPPDEARRLYQGFVDQLAARHQPLAGGIFGADMQVHLVNDGPVTFLLEL